MRTIKFTFVFLLTAILYAQNWTWVGGNLGSADSRNLIAIPGTKGAAGSSHYPGSRDGALSWTDKDGNFWLFGGHGFVGANNSSSNAGKLNDFWKYDLSTGFWTWMGGNLGSTDAKNLIASPGTKGVAASSNYPGSRTQASTWTDNDGNLWLFGGYGYVGINDSQGAGQLNDFWKYDISTGYWTWVGGDLGSIDAKNLIATPGTKGVAASSNYPGAKVGATAWTDNDGNLWMFGGDGPVGVNNSQRVGGQLNDFWKYDISTGYWTWVGGDLGNSDARKQVSVGGTKGVAASTNYPGSRNYAVSWTDNDGNFWMFGGWGFVGPNNSQSAAGYLNDLWKYDVSTGYWTWFGGDLVSNQSPGKIAVPGTKGIPASLNFPGGKTGATSWTDNDGNLWLFGGEGKTGNNQSQAQWGYLNDLWKYDLSTGYWTWISGFLGSLESRNRVGNPGTKGTASSGNYPGGTAWSASWVSNDGELWIFGGSGYIGSGDPGTFGYHNSLWNYDFDQSAVFATNNSELRELINGEGRWGDYDNDGDYDLAVSGIRNSAGSQFNHIYKNSNGNFTSTEPTHTWIQYHGHSSVDWGDIDSDGSLDLFVMGDGANYSAVYKNINNGSTHSLKQKLIELNTGSARFADFDNDGDLDLYMFGREVVNRSGQIAYQFYQNTNGTFSEVSNTGKAMESASRTTLVWGDYDNDGDMDFLQCGSSSPDYALLFNNNNGTFSAVNNRAGLDQSENTHGIFIDYDNDGDLDIVLSKNSETDLYENNNAAFTKVQSLNVLGKSFSIMNGGLAAGDYDNDGDMDIIFNGETRIDNDNKGSRVTLFRNEYGNFQPVLTSAGGERGNVEFADYDNDGDLDYFWLGSRKSKIVTNTTQRKNSKASKPTGLEVNRVLDKATFSWNKATDTETPQEALTYNLRVGTTSGGHEIMSAMSNSSNGDRLVPRRGNVDFNTSWKLNELANKTYYWSVQAVDSGYKGGAWASEQSFTISDSASLIISTTAGSISKSSPIGIKVVSDVPVTGFEASDITVTNGSIGNFSGSDSVYTFDITPSENGTVTVRVPAEVCVGSNNLKNRATSLLSIIYDNQNPTIAITSTKSSPTTSNSIPITVKFSENVTGFTSSDITLTNSSISNFSGSNKERRSSNGYRS